MKKTDKLPQSNLLTITDLQRSLDLLLAMPDAPSVMIWGPPGVGKSSAVRALAERHGIGLVDLRLGQLAPTDLRGLPVPDHEDRRATWYPPAFLPTEGRGILFLDELNLAPPVMQGIAQQLVLDRRVGDYAVPEGWVVWAAGNRKEDRAAVYEMPAPVANRFVHFEVGAEIEGFRAWAADRGFDELLLAFLLFRPELLHKPDSISPAWPSPRSWDMADRLLRAGLPIASAVGQAAAGEFAAFHKLCQRLPDVDGVLNGGGGEVTFPKEASHRYATIIALALRPREATAMRAAARWVGVNAGAEWCRLFALTAWERARRNGTVGVVADAFANEEKLRPYLHAHAA
jgi:MoxR-like ATPase